MDHTVRIVPHSQRDRCFRKHHGWVRAKRCGFCERLSHVDEMGVSAPPWRVRGRGARSILTWYCSTQCAQNLDTSRAGWRHRAPFVYPADFTVPDIDPAWMHPEEIVTITPGELRSSPNFEGEPAMPAIEAGASWADDGLDDSQFNFYRPEASLPAKDIKFGSF